MTTGYLLGFVGTLLIAYQLVGKASHGPALLLLIAANLLSAAVQHLNHEYDRRRSLLVNYVNLIPKVALLYVSSVTALALLAASPVVLVVWGIGRLLVFCNWGLNTVYQQQLRRQPIMLNWLTRKVLGYIYPTARMTVTDEAIAQAVETQKIPFVGIAGLTLLLLSFAWNLWLA